MELSSLLEPPWVYLTAIIVMWILWKTMLWPILKFITIGAAIYWFYTHSELFDFLL